MDKEPLSRPLSEASLPLSPPPCTATETERVEKTAVKISGIAAWVIAKAKGGKAALKRLSRHEGDSLRAPHPDQPESPMSLGQKALGFLRSAKHLIIHKEGGKLSPKLEEAEKPSAPQPTRISAEDAKLALEKRFGDAIESLQKQEDFLKSAKEALEEETKRVPQNEPMIDLFELEVESYTSSVRELRDKLKEEFKGLYSIPGAKDRWLKIDEAAQDTTAATPTPGILKSIHEEIEQDALKSKLGEPYERILEGRTRIKESQEALLKLSPTPDNKDKINELHISIRNGLIQLRKDTIMLKEGLQSKTDQELTEIQEHARAINDTAMIDVVKDQKESNSKKEAVGRLQAILGANYGQIPIDRNDIKELQDTLIDLKSLPLEQQNSDQIEEIQQFIAAKQKQIEDNFNNNIAKFLKEDPPFTIETRAEVYNLAKTLGDKTLMDIVKTLNTEAGIRDIITNPNHSQRQAFIEDSSVLVTPDVVAKLIRKEVEYIASSVEKDPQRLTTVLEFAAEWTKNTNRVPGFQNPGVQDEFEEIDKLVNSITTGISERIDFTFTQKKDAIIPVTEASNKILINRTLVDEPITPPTNPGNDILTQLQSVKTGEISIGDKKYKDLVNSVAQDLTNAQVAILKQMTPSDLTYISEGKTENLSPAGRLYLDMFNKTQTFITTVIVNETEAENSKNLMKFFLRVAEKCLENNDLATPLAIARACDSTPVKRIPEIVDSKNRKEILPKLDHLYDMSNAYGNYKGRVNELRDKPYVPCALMTVNFLEFGNKGNPEVFSNGKMNAFRLKTHHDQLSSFFSTRDLLEQKEPSTNISEQILKMSGWEKAEKQLYTQSQVVSPREKPERKLFSIGKLRTEVKKQIDIYKDAEGYINKFPVVGRYIERYVDEEIQKHPEYNEITKEHDRELLFERAYRFLNVQIIKGAIDPTHIEPISEQDLKDGLRDYL